MNNRSTLLQQRLLAWFRENGRNLPWRKTYDPYHVWISEIMLQQTQMERGVQYFKRWVVHFPDIHSVAMADEHEILKLWEGLGYYTRARNLHAAAKVLDGQFDGNLPCDLETLLSLPGIGPYTASAILSIACNQDVVVVDANVMRVYARLFDVDGNVKTGKGHRIIQQIALDMLPAGHARAYNQALMDFGGMVCLPRTPLCEQCPLADSCQALANDTVAIRPLPAAGKKTILIEMATGILEHKGKLFIQQRLPDDIWGGLWEFPGGRVESGENAEQAVVREYLEETGFQVSICSSITTVTHFYTRYKVILHCFGCRLESESNLPELTAAQSHRWVVPEQVRDYGFPAGHRKLLEYIDKSCPGLLHDPCRECNM